MYCLQSSMIILKIYQLPAHAYQLKIIFMDYAFSVINGSQTANFNSWKTIYYDIQTHLAII